jgi:3-methyladenine DNA glycosylase Mpg
MLNVTAEEPGIGRVLLRAIEPLDGINLMKRLRKTDKLTDSRLKVILLHSIPGILVTNHTR